MLLEDRELGALVDGALVDGVGDGEVDDAAEEDSVADLGVEVAAVVAEGQDVTHAVALVPQEAGVDPVGDGPLLLLRHHVVSVAEVRLGLLLDRLLGTVNCLWSSYGNQEHKAHLTTLWL